MKGASFLDAAIMRYEHPHNEFVLLLTESGITGLIVYLLIFIYFISKAIKEIIHNDDKKKKAIIFLMAGAIISIIILAMFGYPFHRPYTMVLFVLACLFIAKSSDSRIVKKNLTPVFIFFLLFSALSVTVYANRLSGEYYFHRALSMQANGNFGGMLRMIRKSENKYFTTDLSSTPIDWYKGFALFYNGNDSAMYYYKLAEQQNPFHIQTLSDIGALLENQGKHEEAIQYFNRVVSIVPGYFRAHYNLAVAYFNIGRPVDALKEINERMDVGEVYLNTLDVILAKNAELVADSCGDKTKTQKFIMDKVLLRNINKASLKSGKSFASIACDSLHKK
jgi:hypothetical protein